MKHQQTFQPARGFTLIELLVVIAIIVILASAGFGVGASAIKNAQKKVAKNDCAGLVIAIDGFYDEYQRLPGVTQSGDPTLKTESELMNPLVGFDDGADGENPKGIRFFSGREAKGDTRTKAYNGLFYQGRSAELFDPFRRDGTPRNGHYFVKLDGDYDEELTDPTSQGKTIYGKRAIVWSVGADNELGSGTDAKTKDNVYSWK